VHVLSIRQLTNHQEIDELVDDWTPEPLVAAQTASQEAENEKRPVIVGCVIHSFIISLDVGTDIDGLADPRVPNRNSQMAVQ